MGSELLRLKGRFHTKVDLMEDECWIYPKKEFRQLNLMPEGDTYYYSTYIDTVNMTKLPDEYVPLCWGKPELPRQYQGKKRKFEGNEEI